MAQHVLARVSGFGWTLIPFAPFRLEQSGHGPRSIVAEYHAAGGTRRAVVHLEGGSPEVELGEGVESLDEVLSLMEGPDHDHWRIETTVFTAR
jgi:hypothetical protein